MLNIDWDFTHSLDQLSDEERRGTPSLRLHSRAAAAGLVPRVMGADGTLACATEAAGNPEVALPSSLHFEELYFHSFVEGVYFHPRIKELLMQGMRMLCFADSFIVDVPLVLIDVM